ncbi:hypothetical protein DERP_011110 [Dermatophagoides pteronyssinus]|uniref:Uncharacterized protein n=1 Tax=Dermatophagoides pteronyssinus TaxID=6956 RepID=A0ABQ8J8V4_DERPT|nr:hypothetical protein DERP_011110 [Dermatophagoides pteronyssinus]
MNIIKTKVVSDTFFWITTTTTTTTNDYHNENDIIKMLNFIISDNDDHYNQCYNQSSGLSDLI